MVNSNKKETKVLPLKKKPRESSDLSSRLKALQESIDNGSYKVPVSDLVSSFLDKNDESSLSDKDSNAQLLKNSLSSKNLKILKKEE
jgi:hypothetical protein